MLLDMYFVLEGWKPDSDWRKSRQGELFPSPSKNSSLRSDKTTLCVEEKSDLWNKIENVPDYVYKKLFE